jgi:hypothetical protein
LARPLIDALALRQWTDTTVRQPRVRSRRPPIRLFARPGERDTFVETETFYGDMLAALSPDFDRLYSVELHPGLARARQTMPC